MENTIVAVTEKINGLLFYSESENPYTIEQWDISISDVQKKIASENNEPTAQLKVISAEDFFDNIITAADPNDAPVAENAKKSTALFSFLKNTTSDLTVTRVEGSTKIPIYITGQTKEGNIIVLKTISIES